MRGVRFFVSFLFFAFFLVSLFCVSAEAFWLSDTGQTVCYSVKGTPQAVTCPLPGSASAQDGSYNFNPPDLAVSYPDSTVYDANTRLTWQHFPDRTPRSCSEAQLLCENLVQGPYSDWRLPSRKELISILDFGRYSPSADPVAFPDATGIYWSSTNLAPSNGNISVGFQEGYTSSAPCPDDIARLMTFCVSGEPLSFGDFIDNGNGTILDRSTGLVWQKSEPGPMTWKAALQYCEGLTLAGFSDWRLPNIRELESIEDDARPSPYINLNFFPGAYNAGYWSSTTHASNWGSARVIYFNQAMLTWADKGLHQAVRCMRDIRERSEGFDDVEIAAEPPSLGFGKVSLGSETTMNLTISNRGYGDLLVGTIEGPLSHYELIYDECTNHLIPWQASCTLTVKFSARTKGVFPDTLLIPSNDADNPLLQVGVGGSTGSYLPDSGQDKCYDAEGQEMICPQPGSSLAQDGSYTINPLSYLTGGNGTVTDNNTGLMWQQASQQANWFEATGTYHKRYNKSGRNVCGDMALIGHTDWRLPLRDELNSLTNYGLSHPEFDAAPFTTSCPGGCGLASDMTIISPNGTLYPVRCVRGEPVSWRQFQIQTAGTVTDSASGLMWQQTAESIEESNSLQYCEQLQLAGFTDWRLPNIRELTSLVDYTRSRPTLDTAFFSQSLTSYDHLYFWTSTPVAVTPANRWCINFADAGGCPEDLNTALGCSMGMYTCATFARCVRNLSPETSPASLSGYVFDISSGEPVSDALITVTTSTGPYQTRSSVNGNYGIGGIPEGDITVTFEKNGYAKKTISAHILAGQTLSPNGYLSPVPLLVLTITSPTEGQDLHASPVEVRGSVTNTAQVTVNGQSAAVTNGAFSAQINLIEGLNTIVATATDQNGQTTTQSITVTYTIIRPPVLAGITVSNVSADSALITWTTDQPADSRVEYGETVAYGSSISDSSVSTTHGIMLNGLRPSTTYHFNVASTNVYGLSSASADGIFSTRSFTARGLGDFGNVVVMEVTGNYDGKNPDGTINDLPRQEIAKEFLRSHPDQYDFIVVVSNFDFAMPQTEARGFYLEVKNDTQGIGKSIFDNSASFGSNSKLQGMIDMGNITNLGLNPFEPEQFDQTIDTLAHEQMHRWGTQVKFRDSGGGISRDLLGKDGTHWSYLLDSDGSLMYGNDWMDNGNGTFTSVSASRYYSALDLYLMGLVDKTDVTQMTFIENTAVDPTKLPGTGATITGTAKTVTLNDIISAEGERIPSSAASQKSFRTAFIFVVRPGTFLGTEPSGIEILRNAWAGRFAELTHGKGSVADVPPTLFLTVNSPTEGQAVADSEVMVRGTLINSTGNETGVTVNGMIATVYGNQFIANHVPLTEGQTTISVTATASDGNTVSTSVSVNAVVTGNYLRLVPNIESGISPLEVLLRVDSSFSITASNLNVVGPVQPEALSSAPEEYKLRFTVEGVYYATVTATGPDGLTYQDMIAITVLNRTQLDYLLKAKWEGMKTALMAGDIETAIAYFVEGSKARYRQTFLALTNAQLDLIFSAVKDIKLAAVYSGTTECGALREESDGIYSYPVAFVNYWNGIWQIMGF